MIIKILNECNCVFELDMLIKGIHRLSDLDNSRIRNEYRIYKYKNELYPMLSIGHKKYRIHNVILERKKGFHVHHKNENVLDNRLENLEYVTPKEHIYKHKMWEKIDKNKLSDNARRGSKKITRHDITKEKILTLRNQGYTISQIQKILNCGYNTVWRRLSKGNPKLLKLDWSE